ncbi:hypothetical protein A1D29_07745 [Pasteurellaceae bacterium Orientalotternb1]|nr:hypothetical protein A1D29_07745 [Pasteurellaceae bacterium Orientalotternb1]
MKQPILYSFVRYRPYFETGEFVNVGLLMCEPERQKLTYRLVNKNNKRVTDFFYRSKLFESVRETINQELDYIVNQAFNFTPQEMARFFHHYVDVKEGIVQYSNAAVGVVDDPQVYFNQLYTQFIQNAGVKSESQENEMIKHYRAIFKAHHNEILSHYKQHLVQGEMAKFTLPLALKSENSERILKGIKPLAFDQVETSSMIEHCDTWVAKINRATEEGLLEKEDILFMLDTADTKSKANILTTIKKTFDRFKIPHTGWQDKEHILSFATNIKTF